MDFNIKNPKHLIAAFLLFLSLLMFVIVPILSFFGIFGNITSTTSQIDQFPDNFKIIFEVLTLLIQLVLVTILFVLVPFTWYKLVNKYSFSEIISAIRFRKENLDMTLLYGIITAAVTFIVIIGIGVMLSLIGIDLEDASNIKDIQQIFSLPATLVLIIFQPIAEEIFYRGFLLEKIEKLSSAPVAITITAILFGLAHLSSGNIYPALLTTVAGGIFAFLVIKTKNLTAAIIAHIVFNIASFTVYTIGQSIM